MGYRLVKIARHEIAGWLVTGADWHVNAGLPAKAQLRGATFVGDHLVLTFEHPSWAESSETLELTITTGKG
jgi:hypothetical protein